MARFGIHSGEAKYKNVRADDKFVYNREVMSIFSYNREVQIPFQFSIASGILGHFIMSTSAAVLTGISIVGRGATVITPSFQFTHADRRGVNFNTVIPSDLPADTSMVVKPYWTEGYLSGVTIGSDNVVWGLKYVINPLSTSSGVIQAPRTRQISSTLSYAATLGTYRPQAAGMTSGVLCTTDIVISGTGVVGNAYVNCVLYRDATATVDDLDLPIQLVAVVVEYK